MNARIRIISTAALVLLFGVLGTAAWQLPKLRFNSDLLALFPSGSGDSATQYAEQQLNDFVSNRVFFLVGAGDLASATAHAHTLAATLDKIDSVAHITLEQDQQQVDELLSQYRQYPWGLINRDEFQIITANPQSFVDQQVRSAYQSPAGLRSAHFLQDPFDFSSRFLTQTAGVNSSRLSLEDNVLATFEDKKVYVFLQLALNESAYSVEVQSRVGAAIQSATQAIQNADSGAEVLVNGVIQFAAAGTRQAKSEISTVGVGSLVGIFIVFLWMFRSPSILALSLIPTAFGVLCGVLAVQSVFGAIHIVTMVFGASLVGVSIDYSLHFFVTRMGMSADPDATWSVGAGIKRLFNGVTLGLITSTCAYLTFVFSGFPGFQQIAVFSASGLLGAYLTVMGVFPLLAAKPHNNTASLRWFARARWVLERYSKLQFNIFAALILGGVCAYGLFNITFEDDIRQMQKLDEELVAQSNRFQEIAGQQITYQFYLVSGPDDEQMLQNMEALGERLHSRDVNYRSISRWLPSQLSQTQVADRARELIVNNGLLQNYLHALNIVPSAQEDIVANLQRQQNPLTISQVYPSIQAIVGFPIYFQFQQQSYGIVLPASTLGSDALATIADGLEQVQWVDTVANTNDLFTQIRAKSTQLLLAAYVTIWLFLSLRYGLVEAVKVIAPPLLASVIALSIMGLSGVAVNVFNLMALLLVLGIGIDYSLFLRESRDGPQQTYVAIMLSAVTTILAFGLLSLSRTYAISSFGITILLGIFLCLLFAPIASLKKAA